MFQYFFNTIRTDLILIQSLCGIPTKMIFDSHLWQCEDKLGKAWCMFNKATGENNTTAGNENNESCFLYNLVFISIFTWYDLLGNIWDIFAANID